MLEIYVDPAASPPFDGTANNPYGSIAESSIDV